MQTEPNHNINIPMYDITNDDLPSIGCALPFFIFFCLVSLAIIKIYFF